MSRVIEIPEPGGIVTAGLLGKRSVAQNAGA